MKVLFWIFIGMFWYGVLVGPLGAGLLSFVIAVFVYWADKRFAAQDKAWINDPSNAPTPCDTLQKLRETEQESSCSRL